MYSLQTCNLYMLLVVYTTLSLEQDKSQCSMSSSEIQKKSSECRTKTEYSENREQFGYPDRRYKELYRINYAHKLSSKLYTEMKYYLNSCLDFTY